MDNSVFISAAIAGIITWIFVYIDARLFDNPKSKSTYLKIVLFVMVTVAATVYFMTGEKTSDLVKSLEQLGGNPGGPQCTPDNVLNYLKDTDMLTGAPPF